MIPLSSYPDSTHDSEEEDSETEETPEPAAGPFGLWTTIMGEDPGPPTIPFTATPGLKVRLDPTSSPLQYFQLFFSDQLINLIVDETNRYSNQWIESHQDYLRQKPSSRVHAWIRQGHTTLDEMKAFLSVVINMGIIKKPTIDQYWNTHQESQSTPWFPEHMNRDRFQLLLKFLHFSNNQDMPAHDHPHYKLFKVQPIIDALRKSFKKLYAPHRNVAIDESMVGYRGRTPHLRVYMPNKYHARFGMKLWCVCDSETQYTCLFEVFKGTHEEDQRHEEGITYSLVMRLLRETELLYQGYHIGLDNYFTSPKLFLDLFQRRTLATGTVRSNRKGLPKQLLKAKLNSGEVSERRKGPLLCVAYKDHGKRPILLSTETKAGYGTSLTSTGVERRKPKCVIAYNSAMGGVDCSDARLYAYLSERRTLKWTKKLVFSLMGRSLLNAYIIYKEHSDAARKLSRLDFSVSVLEELMDHYQPLKTPRKRKFRAIAVAEQGDAPGPAPIEPPTHSVVSAPIQHQLEKIQLRRMCLQHRQKNKKTNWQCVHCKVSLCPECFVPYHKAHNLQI